MSEKIIDEVMELVEEYGAECEHGGYKFGYVTLQAIRAMVGEVISHGNVQERKPLSDCQIKFVEDSVHFHESVDWNLRFARAIERAHGIGEE